MPGGPTPPSLLYPPAPTLRSPSRAASTPSGEIQGEPLASGEVYGKLPALGDIRTEKQDPGSFHGEEPSCSKVPKSLKIKPSDGARQRYAKNKSQTIGGKRSLSEPSESSRANKAAKHITEQIVKIKLENSKAAGRKTPPIVCSSRMINMMARRKSLSNARSPNSHGSGILKSPSLHDLSPAPSHGSPASSQDLSPAATTGPKRRPRKLTSVIWNDAEPIYIDGYLMQGRCKYCNTVFPASKVSGNSQLARHLKVCEVKSSMDGVIQQIKTSDEIDPNWKFDQEAARIELVKLIVSHVLPFTFVEYSGFRKFCKALNPWFKSVNRVTIQNDCIDTYHSYRNEYVNFFMNCNHRVSLTGDMWTSNQKLGYLCITCHWIDSKWRVRHRILRFCMLETPHDSWNMLDVVLQILRDWNIENRIFSFTMDNAAKHINEVTEAFAALYIAYAAECEDNVDFLSQDQNGEEVVVANNAFSDWDEHVKSKEANSRDELQRYLEEGFHPRTPDFDILKWWEVNSVRYPLLGSIARDVLAVPASTVASESAFSTCGRVITDHRSSLAAETVEALMCFGDWIKPDDDIK